MKILTLSILLLLGFAMFPYPALAQKSELKFEKVLDNNGKPFGYVTDLTQDQDGFIWFTTLNGLFRYDGYGFKVFRNVFNDSTSVPFNSFQGIHFDSSGNAWLICRDTEGRNTRNVIVYNPDYPGYRTRKIEIADPEKVIEDGFKNIWISTSSSGLYRYDQATGKTENFCKSFTSYPIEIYRTLDSVFNSGKVISEIVHVTDNQSIEKSFVLERDTPVLIVSMGEADGPPMVDYSWLTSRKDTVWKMSFASTRLAGGATKNRIELKTDTLKAGRYVLHYNSDDSHSYGKWNEAAPTVLDFYGVKILQLNKELNSVVEPVLNSNPGKNAILSNNVRDMVIDSLGKLWILSYQGIAEFDYSQHLFINHEISFSSILKKKNGTEGPRNMYMDKKYFWFTTFGKSIIRYNPNTKLWRKYEDEVSMPEWFNGYGSVNINNKGQLLLPGFASVSLMDTASGKFTNYTSKDDNIYESPYSFIQDKGGTYWVISSEGLNKGTKMDFGYTYLFPVYYHKFLKHTYLDNNGTLWFLGTEKNGFSSYNFKTRDTVTYRLIEKNMPKIVNVNPNYIDFLNFIYEDSKNNIWLAISNGLYSFDRAKKGISGSVLLNDTIFKGNQNEIVRIFEDSSNELLVFSMGGIYRYDYGKGSLSLLHDFNLVEEASSNTRTNNIDYIFEDQDKKLWIRTYKGLYTYKKTENRLDCVITFEKDYYEGIHRGNIYSDSEKNIWLATYANLYRIAASDMKITKYKIRESFKKVDWNVGYTYYKIIPGDKNTLWLSTGFGLVKFDRRSENIKVYSDKPGMVSNNIQDFDIDSRGILWLATEDGISKFEPSNEIFTYYRETSAMSHDMRFEHQFINANKMKDGSILFFATYGIVIFNPESYNKELPGIVITGFSVKENVYRTDTIINLKKKISLKYNQNFFSLSFSSLDYENPEHNWYKYKLEGVDADWTICDALHRTAKYTKVAPGEYTFRVIGSNSDGVWNEKGVSLQIIVSPPWYRTLLAYFFYIIIIACAFYIYIRFRERKLRLYSEHLESQVKDRTAKIEKQKEEIQAKSDIVLNQKEHIEEIHKGVTDSINYAKRIQTSALPDTGTLNQYFSDLFIVFRPRDVVSGDFYWFAHIENRIIITVVDCTGHGVPGAFMSMLGMSLLKEIVVKEYITQPDIILRRMRKEVIKALGQTGISGEQKDGMDISLCSINTETYEMQWSGANIPCLIVKNGQLIKLEADKMPIAIYDKMDKFTLNEIKLEKNDIIYLASDGFSDQFGGPENRKFMSSRFRELLLEISVYPMPEQRDILEKAIEDWLTGNKNYPGQTDDITVMGIKI